MNATPLRRLLRMAGLALSVLLALGLAAHGFVWWRATGALRTEAARWIDARAAEGTMVRHGPPARGGWPFAATLTLPAVLAEARLADGIATLSADRLVLALRPADPRSLEVRLEGELALAAETAEAALAARARAGLLRLDLPLGRPAPDRPGRLAARFLVVESGADRLAAEALSVEVRRDPAASGEQPGLALAIAATGVDLPAAWRPALGPRVARAALDVQLVGRLGGFGPPRAQAIAWRDAGGFVQVPRLQLDWGPLSLAADATLALDEAVQPSGAGRARASGLVPALDTLAANGAIPRQTAQMGRGVVALMQRTPPGGGAPVVELPLVLQNRTLSAGRITLLRLPPIELPR